MVTTKKRTVTPLADHNIDDFRGFNLSLKTPVIPEGKVTAHNIEDWTRKECEKRQPYAPRVTEDLRLEHTFYEMFCVEKELKAQRPTETRAELFTVANHSKQQDDTLIQNEAKKTYFSILDRFRKFGQRVKSFFSSKTSGVVTCMGRRNKVFPETVTLER